MADTGWLRHPDDDGWVLLGEDGEQEPGGVVTDDFITHYGLTITQQTLALQGYPPLPGFPDLACQLRGGPQDGRWVFFPLPVPPDSLSFTQETVPAGGTRRAPLGWDRYVLTGQSCGNHGPGCPYTYQWESFSTDPVS